MLSGLTQKAQSIVIGLFYLTKSITAMIQNWHIDAIVIIISGR